MLAKLRFQQYYVGVIDCHTPLSTKYYVGVIDHCSFFSFCGQCNTAELSSTVNNQAGIFKGNSKIMKSFLDFFVRFLRSICEFVQLDVASSMKPKQTTQTCALSSTASEARSINLERQGHRRDRNTWPDGL